MHLITECQVEKLALELLSSGDVVAAGVYVTRNGTKELLKARKEVLLCAGVFHSLQLLELSGIGDAQLLQSHGIEVLVDNPNVGENLQDHPLTGMCYEVVDGLPTIDMIRDPEVIQGAMTAYMTSREGPLTSGFHAAASIPELQYASIRSILENPAEASAVMAMGATQFHFDKETHKDIFSISDPHNYMCFLVSLANPLSSGTVHITTGTVQNLPAVDPQYLSHPVDIEILARNVQWVPTLVGTKPLADYVKPNGAVLPKGTDVSSLDKAREHVKRNTFNHPCGTCAMMSFDLGDVVDDRLRVYGVNGLRVVASVFPMIPKGFIQSSVYAVAEKAADLIKEDYS
ncbi:hypothetical protein V1521DRAFT_403916 [Lipomyces starkeyi]